MTSPDPQQDPQQDPAPRPGPSPVPQERRHPSTVGGALYLLVLLAVGAGLAVTVAGDWRLGVRVLSGALGAAAASRLVLPGRDAGMLAVRHRAIDVTLLSGVGLVLWVLSASIPDQPGT